MPKYCEYYQRGHCGYGNRCKFLHAYQGEEDRRHERISKLLSNVLRHKAHEFGIAMREDGYCLTSDIMNHAAFKSLLVTQKDLDQIVNDNAKKRFATTKEGSIEYIRANQGHTIEKVKDEQLLTEIPEEKGRLLQCYHGTYRCYMEMIEKEGLKCMGRNHMHFACPALSSGPIISGMREDCEVKLILDMNKCFDHKMKFFQSENGVVLTKGLPVHNVIPWNCFTREDLAEYRPNAKNAEPAPRRADSSCLNTALNAGPEPSQSISVPPIPPSTSRLESQSADIQNASAVDSAAVEAPCRSVPAPQLHPNNASQCSSAQSPGVDACWSEYKGDSEKPTASSSGHCVSTASEQYAPEPRTTSHGVDSENRSCEHLTSESNFYGKRWAGRTSKKTGGRNILSRPRKETEYLTGKHHPSGQNNECRGHEQSFYQPSPQDTLGKRRYPRGKEAGLVSQPSGNYGEDFPALTSDYTKREK